MTSHPSSPSSEGEGEEGEGGSSFEWRVLRFGEATRQSVCRVEKTKSSLLDPTCLAFEYTKTLVALSLALLPLRQPGGDDAVPKGRKRKSIKVLAVGVGGGSVPAALAALRPDVQVSAFEIDERVVGSWPAMGLVASAVAAAVEGKKRGRSSQTSASSSGAAPRRSPPSRPRPPGRSTS